MVSLPSNELRKLLEEFKRASIDEFSLRLLDMDYSGFRKSLEQCSVSDENMVYRQLYYLTQEYSDKFYVIPKIEGYPPLHADLEHILNEKLRKCSTLQSLEAQQYFHFILTKRRHNRSTLATKPKETKWGKCKIILHVSKEEQKSDFYYFLPEMDYETAKEEHRRWKLGFSNSIDGADKERDVEWKNYSRGQADTVCPVFVLPGISGENLNQLFIDPRNDNNIISAMVKKFNEKENDKLVKRHIRIEGEEPAGYPAYRLGEPFIFFKKLFPRIDAYWDKLSEKHRFFVYSCFLNAGGSSIELIHQENRVDDDSSKQPFVHGDEWGNNFHLSKKNGLISIDFDDLLVQNISENRHSHLYRRIWERTDKERFVHYLGTGPQAFVKVKQPSEIELTAHLDTSRSMGRLFCSLVQFWMLEEGRSKPSDSDIDRFDSLLDKLKKKMDKHGLFFASFIDWALEWGENDRRAENKFQTYHFFIERLVEKFGSNTSYFISKPFNELLGFIWMTDENSPTQRDKIKEILGIKMMDADHLVNGQMFLLGDTKNDNENSEWKEFVSVEPGISFKQLSRAKEVSCPEPVLRGVYQDLNQSKSAEKNDPITLIKMLNQIVFNRDVMRVDVQELVSEFEKSPKPKLIENLWNSCK